MNFEKAQTGIIYPEFNALKIGVVTGIGAFGVSRLWLGYTVPTSIGISLAAYYLMSKREQMIWIKKSMEKLNVGTD